jgi:hypothetical protein
MKPPESLKSRGPGRRFWREVTDAYHLSPDETEVLKRACHVLDRIAELQRVADVGVVSKGSKGQVVVNPAFRELRLQEALLARLLAQVEFPMAHGTGDATGVVSLASRRGRKAARARWARQGGG